MPKQIKKRVIPKNEKQNRILAIIAMIMTFAFAGVMLATLNDFMEEESAVLGCVIFSAYALFFVASLTHCFHGLYVFKKSEHYGIFFQSILSAVASFTAMLNLPFALVLLFSAVGKDSLANKILGTRTMDDFIAAQAGSWKMLMFGMGAMVVIGFFSMVKLINRK